MFELQFYKSMFVCVAEMLVRCFYLLFPKSLQDRSYNLQRRVSPKQPGLGLKSRYSWGQYPLQSIMHSTLRRVAAKATLYDHPRHASSQCPMSLILSPGSCCCCRVAAPTSTAHGVLLPGRDFIGFRIRFVRSFSVVSFQ